MDWPCSALAEAPLGDRTTMHVGGRAEWLLEPATPTELEQAWRTARDRGFEVRVLGGGANLLIDDGLLPGVVVATERMRRTFRPAPEDGDGAGLEVMEPDARIAPPERATSPRLVAWAGATLPSLVRVARDLGLAGLEGLVGVPGHLGGGVAMNAGGRPGDMWDVLESVHVLDAAGETRVLRRDECDPLYRNGNLKGWVVLGAVLRLEPDSKAAIQERMRDYLATKNAAQPVTEWSCGCVFKNPDPELAGGLSAGQLVESVGAKGLERGDAIVSPKHGNFIVNRGQATASEVLSLIQELQQRVGDQTGVGLELEVKRWSH